jgi:hypothetical protein
MQTLAQAYRHALALFTHCPESPTATTALEQLVSQYLAQPCAVAFVDVIHRQQVTETHRVFWQSLEPLGVCIRFFMRCDGFAYVGLCPIYPEANTAAQSVEYRALEVAA